ncbi:MAG: ADOP family duplicated permease [Bryobacteraceae bacterium]
MRGILAKEAIIVLRGLYRERSYTIVSILLLAIGIGLTSAVFTLLWQAVYASLPVPDPAHLYALSTNVTHNGRAESDVPVGPAAVFSLPTYRYLASNFTAASGITARHGELVNIETPQGPQHLRADFVAGNFFAVVGLKPIIGRPIAPSDDTLTGEHFSAVLSYNFWQEAFGSQLSVLNNTIRVNGLPFRIIGIAPKNFTGLISGQAPHIYLPVAAYAAINPGWNKFDDWSFRWLNVFARLPAQMPHARAEAELQPVYHAAVREELATQSTQSPEYLRELAHEHMSLTPASQGLHAMLDEWQKPLEILQWMTLAVLLLTSLNVAGLTVVRAIKQRQETLVRYAMGASRAAVMRLHFIQTLTLSIAAGAAALWIAHWGAKLLIHLARMDRGGAVGSQPNSPTIAFHSIAVIGAGLLIGLFPALYAARIDLARGLNEGAGTHSLARSHVVARRGLAAMQIALSLVLVVAAALFAKSLHSLTSVPVGFNPDRLMLFSIDPKLSGATVQTTELLYSRIANRLKETLGVAAVSYGTGGPFPQATDVALMFPGTSLHAPHQSGMRSLVGPNYFRTLGIPILAGREFDERDRLGAPNAVIINQSLAKKLFASANPIGRTVAMFNGVDPTWLATIIGVVADFHVSWKRSNASLIYTAAQQAPRVSEMTFYIRTLGGATLTESQIRKLVQDEMPGLSAYDLATMPARMYEFASGEHAMTLLTAVFASLALLIAVVGIYGVVSYTSSLRTVEFGVRISVGAQHSDIIWLIVREAALIVATGLILAIPFTWLALVSIRTQLYGITFNQPLIYTSAILLLAASGLTAALIPAGRAARMNVQAALRHY